jgi:hypothetical protein
LGSAGTHVSSASDGERFFVIALPAAQRCGSTGDEGADDERQRANQRKGGAGFPGRIGCFLCRDLGLFYLGEHGIDTCRRIGLGQSGTCEACAAAAASPSPL